MIIQKRDMLFGAALYQIAIHSNFTSINKHPGCNENYILMVNHDRICVFKYSKKYTAPNRALWKFNFTAEHTSQITSSHTTGNSVFIVLVCEEYGICLLDSDKFYRMLSGHSAMLLTVSKTDRSCFRVTSQYVDTPMIVSANSFPEDLLN